MPAISQLLMQSPSSKERRQSVKCSRPTSWEHGGDRRTAVKCIKKLHHRLCRCDMRFPQGSRPVRNGTLWPLATSWSQVILPRGLSVTGPGKRSLCMGGVVTGAEGSTPTPCCCEVEVPFARCGLPTRATSTSFATMPGLKSALGSLVKLLARRYQRYNTVTTEHIPLCC